MSIRKTDLDQLGVGLLLVCTLFWGLQQVLIKATLPEIAPAFQAAARFAGATVLLLLWCWWRNIRLFEADGSLKAGLLAGVLFGFEFACLYTGLQFTSVARLTIFLYTSPFWVALLLPLWVESERLRARQWLGLLLAFTAVAMALQFRHPDATTTQHWLGDFLGLAAGLGWGLTTVTIRSSKLTQVSAEKLLLYQIGIAALCLPLLSVALGESWSLNWSAFAAGSMLMQTAIGAFASYLAWMWMLSRYPATKISAFSFLTPVFALILSALWLKEPVSITLVLCLVMVLAGIVLVNQRPRLTTS